MSHDDHDHDHDHADAHAPVSDDGGRSYYELACAALKELLIEKNLLTAAEVRAQVEAIESPGIHLGARIVAHAWKDEAFRQRLLANGKAAAAELGIKVGEAQLVVVENTDAVHNVIVCTLCSCYPRSILGQPPAWYISKAYRARTVSEPRAVLAEFGTTLPEGVELRVHDSNADMRYLVLPRAPVGAQGLSEDALAAQVTRDRLIGVIP